MEKRKHQKKHNPPTTWTIYIYFSSSFLKREKNVLLGGEWGFIGIHTGLLSVGQYPAFSSHFPMNAICWPASRYF